LPSGDTRKQNQAFYEFMGAAGKGLQHRDVSPEVASLGVQVHGGMGSIEETGAAQYLRDAKILTIHEGTTAIQANEAELAKCDSADAQGVGKRLKAAREAFVAVVEFVAGQTKGSPNAVFAGSLPYLMLGGNLVAGRQLARSLLVAEGLAKAGTDVAFMKAKIATARFYAEHILNKAPGLRDSIIEGADSVTALVRAASRSFRRALPTVSPLAKPIEWNGRFQV
jgi:hypothetical protein